MKILNIYDATTASMENIKILSSKSHIGLFNFSLDSNNSIRKLRLFKRIVISKHPLTRTRLLLVSIGKLTVKLYNYGSAFSLHKSNSIYGVHVLFMRLIWNRF